MKLVDKIADFCGRFNLFTVLTIAAITFGVLDYYWPCAACFVLA